MDAVLKELPFFGYWLVQLGIGLFGLVLPFLFAMLIADKRGANNREVLADFLAQDHVRERYRVALDRLGGAIERIYGRARSPRALITSYAFALGYPFITFVAAYAIGGPHKLCDAPVLPEGNAWLRAKLVVGLVGFGIIEAVILWKRRTIDAFFVRNGTASARPLLHRIGLGAIPGVLAAAAVVAVQLATGFREPDLGQIASAFACTFCLIFGFSVAFATAFAFTAAFALAGAGAGAGALAIAFAFAFTGTVALTSSNAVTDATLTDLKNGVACVSGAVFGAASGALIGDDVGVGTVYFPDYFTAILLWIVFPAANAIHDWVSWRVSRYFISNARTTASWRLIGADLTCDALVATLLLTSMVVVLPSAIDATNWIPLRVVQEGVASWLGLFPSHKFEFALNWEGLAAHAKTDPWGKGLMVTGMVLTTFVPTAMHLVCALFAIVVRAVPRHGAIERLQRMNLVKKEDNHINAGWLATQLAFSITLPVVLIFGLFDLASKVMQKVAHWNVASLLYDLAEKAAHPAWLLLLPFWLFVGWVPVPASWRSAHPPNAAGTPDGTDLEAT